MGSSALLADGVTKRFPGVTALDAVTLEVQRGEIHGVVGENGAGKSTLMAVIAGALAPDRGTVRLGDHELAPVTPERARQLGVAIVRQEPALLPDLTVAENMFLGVTGDRRPSTGEMKAWSRRALSAWDENVKIDPAERVDHLLPEHRFIIEIAKALAAEPAVLILDEPTEHLSREDVDRLFVRIRAHAAAGGAVIYISHRIHEVKAISERITVLRDGRGRGTHDSATLTEQEIVRLVVGRTLEATFPAKPNGTLPPGTRLVARELGGHRFSKVSFDVRPGEILGFAGIDGNGQRETMRALAGLGRSSGEVSIDGHRARLSSPQAAVHAGIAYLTGDRHREGVFPGLSVKENVAFRSLPSMQRGGVVTESRVDQFVQTAIEGLAVRTPTLDTPIDSLSGGNQQKALIAGVLATRPKVLLVDEPTQGVDVGAKAEIYRILRSRAQETGTSVIVLSSDALELAGLCDRVAVFSRGGIVREISGEDMTETAITSTALTATSERERVTARMAAPIRWLAGDGAPLAVVAAVVILLGLYTSGVSSRYLSSFNVTATLTLITPLIAAALGQAAVMMTGGIDLSIGPLMGFLVVVESFLLQATNSPGTQVLGWVLMFLLAAAVGALNWSLVEFIRLPPLVATLVTYFALQAVSLLLRSTPGGIFDPAIVNALSTQVGPIPVVFIVVIALALVLQVLLVRSRAGLGVRATGSDGAIARLNGLHPRYARLIAYVGASLLAGVGAVILLAQIGDGDPTSGTNFTLLSISAAVIGGTSIFGGRGSFIAAAAGAFLVQQVVGAIPFLNLSTQWQSYLVGLMTLVAVAVYSKARQVTRAAYQ